jgi:hypothetical protein
MPTYTLRGIIGDLRTIKAPTERQARALAMEARWGKCSHAEPQVFGSIHAGRTTRPFPTYIHSWDDTGWGLDLIQVTS